MKYDVTFTEQAENAAGQLDRIEEKIRFHNNIDIVIQ